jgi:preprotein translocase subunit SecY
MSLLSPLPLTLPIHPIHPNLCSYGNSFFFFVPGDSGNPFAAVWQADLALAAVLLMAGLVLLWLGRVGLRRGIIRHVGWVYIAGAAASALLAGITLATTRPLACYGAPGAGSPSSADVRDYHVFQTVQTLSGLMVYLTLLLLVALVIFFIVAGVRTAWQRGRGNAPAGV